MEQINICRRLKVTNNKLFKQVTKLKGALGLSVIIAAICAMGMVFFAGLYTKEVISKAIVEKDSRDKAMTVTVLQETVNSQNESIAKLSKISTDLYSENAKLVDQLDELDDLKEREELYDKYEYALVCNDNGQRTDVDYNDIKALQDLAEEEGLGEDAVGLVLAISVNESRGQANVKNPNSSAAGLTGLLKSTAKYSWEELLGNGKGTYKSEYVYNSEDNLKMSLAYIAYLKENTNSNYALLVAYRGDDNDIAWFRKIERNMGKSIESLDL